MHTLRHLLVGTDFSAAADAAVDVAIKIASVGHARITIVHVCDPEVGTANAQAQLDHARARLAGTGVEIATLLRGGRPADKLNNAAAEVGATLIVLGRSGLGARQLGGVVDQVMRTANRPVLVVCGGNPS